VLIGLDERVPDLEALYRDLHEHPELSFQEHRTAAVMADRLVTAGFEVATGVGMTGVVGVLRNGDGPGVLLRADMDALPVQEIELVPYRSSAPGVDPDGCADAGHARLRARHPHDGVDRRRRAARRAPECLVRDCHRGLPACRGDRRRARAMLDDGFLDRFPPFEIALGQHISSAPSTHLYRRPGVFMAAADSLRVTIHGRGGPRVTAAGDHRPYRHRLGDRAAPADNRGARGRTE
jgi:hippurate hydrolase